MINAVYLEIGRGHPFYLDGVLEALNRRGISYTRTDVADISRGVAGIGWKLVNRAYELGARGGLTSSLYHKARQRRKPENYGILERTLAREIRALSRATPGLYLVSHPLLVPMISPQRQVFYVHGEIAAPGEAAISRAEIIFVPLQETKASFVEIGLDPSRIIVTGLCLEPGLTEKTKDSFEKRCERLARNEVLTGAFFSSGAEPPLHIRKIAKALKSLRESGQSAIVFCKAGGRLEKEIRDRLKIKPLLASSPLSELCDDMPNNQIRAFSFSSREEESALTAKLFEQFDYLLAPSHERTNWALGLGLPFFILYPLIGPYAPLNRRFLLDAGAAKELRDDRSAESLGRFISVKYNREALLQMAKSNFGKYNIDGFNAIADYIGAMEKTAK